MSIFFKIIITVILTLISQVGGIIYLLAQAIRTFTQGKVKIWLAFPILYFVASISIIPYLANHLYQRVPLPIFSSAEVPLEPRNILFAILNRHYLDIDSRDNLIKAAQLLNKLYPGSVVYYLDANFPFLQNCPLLPHLSHNDGYKVDLCFQYRNIKTGQFTPSHSPLGYWHYEQPTNADPQPCRHYNKFNLRWNFNWLQTKTACILDVKRTQSLLQILDIQGAKKILLEPHLHKLYKSDKIKFQGCRAARHDDHLHVEWLHKIKGS